MPLKYFQKNVTISRAKYICISLFLLVCAVHFFSFRPLWLDENFVLENLHQKTPAELLGPLIHAQAFPRLFLIIIQWISAPGGYSVGTLRIIPFLCMTAAYVVWMQVFRKTLGDNWKTVLGMFTFSCSYMMAYYSSELKFYSMDVLVAGLFSLFLIHQRSWEDQDIPLPKMAAAALLPLTLLFSYAALFVFWMPAYNLLFITRRNKKAWPVFILYCAVSVLCLSVIYRVDLRFSLEEQAIMSYWHSYFVCTKDAGCFFSTFGEGLRRLSAAWFGHGKFFMQWASFLIPFVLYSLIRHGAIPMAKDRFRLFRPEAVFIILFAELFLGGLCHKYPFTGERVTLFFAPFVFYGIVSALFDLRPRKYVFYFFLVNYVVFLLFCYGNSLIVFRRFYA